MHIFLEKQVNTEMKYVQ